MQLVFFRPTNDCPFHMPRSTRGGGISSFSAGVVWTLCTPAFGGSQHPTSHHLTHLSQSFTSALLFVHKLCPCYCRCSLEIPVPTNTTNILAMADHKRSRSPSQSGPRTTAPDLEILADQVTLRPSGYVEPLEQRGGGDKERNLVEHMAKFRSSPLE